MKFNYLHIFEKKNDNVMDIIDENNYPMQTLTFMILELILFFTKKFKQPAKKIAKNFIERNLYRRHKHTNRTVKQ